MVMDLVIYGAQGVALGAYASIKTLFPSRDILCFLVTKIGMNALVLRGIPVRELEEFAAECSQQKKDNIQVLIGTPENEMDEIEKSLETFGFRNHVRLDSERWAQLQKNAFIKNGVFTPLEIYPVGFSIPNLYVFKACSHKDKHLLSEIADPSYLVPIQVGTERTDRRVADVLDNVGDNISQKNGSYSELTGLYWIWKHHLQSPYYGNDCYFGLAQYRRYLELSHDDLLRLRDNDIDVVLPYPMPYEPNIGEHHKRYLSNTEWNAVLQSLQELQPEYAKVFDSILSQEYFYNYNIIIAKKTVLENYCNWLFPILFRIEQINDPNGEKEPNRYMGYIGETLETLYFTYNKNNLCIAHAGCRFLI